MSDPGYIFIAIIIFLAAAAALGIVNARRIRKEQREKLRRSFGTYPGHEYAPDELARIPRYFEKHGKEAPFSVDDITANDLDLWSLFARVNYCQSAAGEEVLYHTLRTPVFQKEELQSREEEICYFAGDEERRLDLQMAFKDLGGSGKYSVYDYLEQLSDVPRKSILPHLLGILALICSVVLMFFSFGYGFIALLAVAGWQIVTYYREKSLLDAYLSTFGYMLRLLSCGEHADRILKSADTMTLPSSLSARAANIEGYLEAMSRFRSGAGMLLNASRTSGSGNPLDIIADYLRMLLHIDLIKFQQMIREAAAHTQDIDALITDLGMIEAMISVACFRASIHEPPEGTKGYCVPEHSEDKALRLRVKDLRHVLLEDGAVANSMVVSRGVLLTGSNASGKSTWLKALGLAAVMSQTIHTVTASSYEAPLSRIYSSMALSDDLQGGESYYIVEIRALSRVLDAAGMTDAPPILCFIDEVLRGTNTVERIAASAQILHHFSHERVLLFAATHDLELTTLLADVFDNYHFEGTLTESDVCFDYLLKKGPSQTRNAIGLLKRFSYDSEITANAEEMAKRFETTGIWSMNGASAQSQGANRS